MELVVRVTFTTMAILALLVALVFPAITTAQSPEPAMAPTSDGVAIDQGIAYVLMFAALVLTYIIH
ncbi:Arabinogalactan peptide [Macleaya cordata]|uniref:Arabinogalactan peptide n=1 Tax=Macleaya cordata TaxID=56857 RepID=A0A200QDK2_MACCD|nr:Arabinogalactan peptide [Macleaya cordata]